MCDLSTGLIIGVLVILSIPGAYLLYWYTLHAIEAGRFAYRVVRLVDESWRWRAFFNEWWEAFNHYGPGTRVESRRGTAYWPGDEESER